MLSEKKVIKVFGNDKPWITTSLRKKIVEKHSSFSQNAPNYNEKQKEVESAIHEAKNEYKKKIEKHFHGNNMRDAWKGIRILTGQDKAKKESPLLQGEGSADRLNSFYARFDDKYFTSEHQNLRESLEIKTKNLPRIEIEEAEIVKVFSNIKTRRAAGPDRIGPPPLKEVPRQPATYHPLHLPALSKYTRPPDSLESRCNNPCEQKKQSSKRTMT